MIKTYKAGVGRTVAIPQSVKPAPGAKTLIVQGDVEVQLDDSKRFVRRSVRNGDLVVVKAKSAKKGK